MPPLILYATPYHSGLEIFARCGTNTKTKRSSHSAQGGIFKAVRTKAACGKGVTTLVSFFSRSRPFG